MGLNQIKSVSCQASALRWTYYFVENNQGRDSLRRFEEVNFEKMKPSQAGLTNLVQSHSSLVTFCKLNITRNFNTYHPEDITFIYRARVGLAVQFKFSIIDIPMDKTARIVLIIML